MKTPKEEALEALDNILGNPRRDIVDIRDLDKNVTILENFIYAQEERGDARCPIK